MRFAPRYGKLKSCALSVFPFKLKALTDCFQKSKYDIEYELGSCESTGLALRLDKGLPLPSEYVDAIYPSS